MRLFHSTPMSGNSGGSALEHFIGNMSGALARARAERDIANARAAAQAAIRARSSFLENMNHELRTPLNAIIGFASMLKDSEKYKVSDEQRSAYAQYVLQSADLLLGHINTILEVAALDNGSIEPSHEALQVEALIEEAIARVEIRALAAKVKILTAAKDCNKNITGHSALIWADGERLGQALDHLLQTAIKSCNSEGKIWVRISSRRENWIELQIRDDGNGFSAEELKQALNSFDQTHRGLSKPFTGPGVGIAIARTFIEMQGGEFTIKSRQGKGTLSTISLPMAEVIAATTHKPAQEVMPASHNVLAKSA